MTHRPKRHTPQAPLADHLTMARLVEVLDQLPADRVQAFREELQTMRQDEVETDRSVVCSNCGTVLPRGDKIPRTPCPNCGSTRRTIEARVELLLTPEQAADRLAVSPRTLREWIRQRRIRAVRVAGKLLRVPESAIAEVISPVDVAPPAPSMETEM